MTEKNQHPLPWVSREFIDVGLFHVRFGLDHALERDDVAPHLPAPELFEFRAKFLAVELRELHEAYAAGDLPKFADALVDLAYVALGTAHHAGLPWEVLWDEVQRANMDKRRETGPRGEGDVAVKPPDWRPPDVAGVLRAHGWDPDR